MENERNYLKEARAILAKESPLAPQLEHLEALQEAHECECIRVANELHNIRTRLLQ